MAEVVDRFHVGGGAGKPMYLQAQHSYAATDEAARAGAYDQWQTNILPSAVLSELQLPHQFDNAAKFVRPEDMDNSIRISADLEQHVAWLHSYIALGFEHIYVHNVNRDQQRFIEAFGERVLPALAKV